MQKRKLIKQTKKNCTSIRSRIRVTNEKKLNYNFWPEKFHNYENKTPLTKFKIVDVVKTISSSSFAKNSRKKPKVACINLLCKGNHNVV